MCSKLRASPASGYSLTLTHRGGWGGCLGVKHPLGWGGHPCPGLVPSVGSGNSAPVTCSDDTLPTELPQALGPESAPRAFHNSVVQLGTRCWPGRARSSGIFGFFKVPKKRVQPKATRLSLQLWVVAAGVPGAAPLQRFRAQPLPRGNLGTQLHPTAQSRGAGGRVCHPALLGSCGTAGVPSSVPRPGCVPAVCRSSWRSRAS